MSNITVTGTLAVTSSISGAAAVQGQSLAIQAGAVITGSTIQHGSFTMPKTSTLSSSGGAVFGGPVIASNNMLVSGTFTVNGSTIQFGDAASDAVTTTAQFTASQGLASVGIITSSAAIKGHSLAIQAGAVITGSTTHHGAFVGTTTVTSHGNLSSSAAIQGQSLAIQNGATITGSSTHHGTMIFPTGSGGSVGGAIGIGTYNPKFPIDINGLLPVPGASAMMGITQYDSIGTNRPAIFLRKSGGTLASPSRPLTISDCGHIFFQGYDGVEFQNAAAIRAEFDGTIGEGDMPGALIFRTTPDGSTTLASRMKIGQAGLVTVYNDLTAAAGISGQSLTVQGNITSSAAIQGQSLTIQAGTSITGSSVHHGTLEVNKSAFISGSLNLSGTLTVSGTTNLFGNPNTIRNTTILDNYNTVLYGPITVNAGGYFKIPDSSNVKIINISDV